MQVVNIYYFLHIVKIEDSLEGLGWLQFSSDKEEIEFSMRN